MANITTTGFATEATKITPSDNIIEANKLHGKAIYAGATGEITVIMAGITEDDDGTPLSSASAVTFKNVQAGTFLPIAVDYVLETGTNANFTGAGNAGTLLAIG